MCLEDSGGLFNAMESNRLWRREERDVDSDDISLFHIITLLCNVDNNRFQSSKLFVEFIFVP